jgi:hypothetical protein
LEMKGEKLISLQEKQFSRYFRWDFAFPTCGCYIFKIIDLRHYSAHFLIRKRRIFFSWRNSLYWVRASSLLRLHDHTQTHHAR